LEEAYRTRRLGEGPLGAVTLDHTPSELGPAVLELVRRNDAIALRHLFKTRFARARVAIEAGDVEGELAADLDRLACVAAVLADYAQHDWFDEVVGTLVDIYAIPFGEGDARRFGFSTRIAPSEVGPRTWLTLMERVYALGALVVRRREWAKVRTLTLQLPGPLVEGGYDTNWLRHAMTMASRAQKFGVDQKLSLLNLARGVASRLDCLRSDGVGPDSDLLLTSLCEFDVLSNIAAVGGAGTTDGRVFYPNFARFRQTRVQPVVEKLLRDSVMRSVIFPLGDDDLATALNVIGERAQQEGWRYDGFEGWEHTTIGEFISQHLPAPT
jgi:hypothetical protein